MKITRTSKFSGVIRTLDIPITETQMQRFNNGEFIDTVCPNLSVPDREFILSGVTAEEWNSLFLDSLSRSSWS